MRNRQTGTFEIGPLPDGLGGPYATATEYYRAWAAKNMNIAGATSDFPSRINDISSVISKYDHGPFRLIHGDFGHHNVLVDSEFNMLAVIDWEKSFVGPQEMAACFPMRLQVYPEAVLPVQRDKDGKVIGGRGAVFDDRERYMAAMETHEMPGMEKLSSLVPANRVQEDILYLIKRWNDKTPWMYNYQPGLRDKVEVVLENIQRSTAESLEQD